MISAAAGCTNAHALVNRWGLLRSLQALQFVFLICNSNGGRKPLIYLAFIDSITKITRITEKEWCG